MSACCRQRCASAAGSSSMPLRRRPWSRSSSRTRPSVAASSTSSSPNLTGTTTHDLQRRLREPLPAHDVAGGHARRSPIERAVTQRRRVRRRRPRRLRGRRRRAARRRRWRSSSRAASARPTSWRRWPASASDRRRPAGPGSTPSPAWTNEHLTFAYGSSSPTKTAADAFARSHRGVPRLRPPRRSRCAAPSASRPATSSGYLPDIAVPDPGTPMDFCAWTEVYLVRPLVHVRPTQPRPAARRTSRDRPWARRRRRGDDDDLRGRRSSLR